MIEIGMVGLVVLVGIGFTAGAGLVAFYAERSVSNLQAQNRYLQRISDPKIRAKGRI